MRPNRSFSHLFLFFATTVIVATTNGAEAQVIVSVNALTCSIVKGRDLLIDIDGAWAFGSNNTGTASFYCPIPSVWIAVAKAIPPDFEMVYLDPDGKGTTAQVMASLTRVHDVVSRGSATDTLATLNSNTSEVTTFNRIKTQLKADVSLSRVSNYTLVHMRRSSSDVRTPFFRAVRLIPGR